MPIFHLATAADWAAAQAAGRYTTSTRGRTLAEEGFIHASRADQWQGVRERYYSDVTEPLVLLVIDPTLLGAPVVEETVGEGPETFPHVYGVIDVAAVTRVLPLDTEPADTSRPATTPTPAATATADHPAASARTTPAAASRSFFSLYLEEMAVRVGAGVAVIVVAVVAGLVVVQVVGDLAGLLTILALFVVGVLVVAALLRRRADRIEAGSSRADSRA